MKFTVWTAGGGQPLPAVHPNRPHHRRLLDVARRLGGRHVLAYCGGCEWFCRRPRRLDDVDKIAHAHLITAHFDALIAGRACLDPDLTDGGEAYLRERLMCVHPRGARL